MSSPSTTHQLAEDSGRCDPVQPLSRDEVNRLVRACSTHAPTGIRNGALIVTLYRSGLRIAQALSLLGEDLDLDAGIVRILQGKGRRARTATFDPGELALLQRWIDVRSALALPLGAPLFCTVSGGRMSAGYVRCMLPRLARRAGVAGRVHAERLRSMMAAELAAAGAPLDAIQERLGHDSPATTRRCLRRSGIVHEPTAEALPHPDEDTVESAVVEWPQSGDIVWDAGPDHADVAADAEDAAVPNT